MIVVRKVFSVCIVCLFLGEYFHGFYCFRYLCNINKFFDIQEETFVYCIHCKRTK